MYHKKKKVCTKCGISKSLNSFVKAAGSPDGRYGTCKVCKNAYKKAWFQSKKETIMSSVAHRHAMIKERSKKLGLTSNIDQISYIALISKNCFYCDSSLKEEKGISLDRIDNDVGYVLSNVLPCCGVCNIGRGTNFTVEEWKIGITAIIAFKEQQKI
jgi:hypothetical protein